MSNEKTYPILLLHGMGFHDRFPGHLYWGRIPKYLRNAGFSVYFGNQDGNASIVSNAEALVPVVQGILERTGCKRLHIIAHSKGGLEARHLISVLGMEQQIASLTTISTPHNGSETVDVLVPAFRGIVRFGCRCMDVWRRILGDRNPDTFTAVEQFTTAYMDGFNREHPDKPEVYYQSYAFVMSHWYSDLPMALPYLIVKAFEGENDGLLTPKNAEWTNFQGVYRGTGMRGISHADETDYSRFRFSGKSSEAGEISDMAAFYVRIAEELRRRFPVADADNLR